MAKQARPSLSLSPSLLEQLTRTAQHNHNIAVVRIIHRIISINGHARKHSNFLKVLCMHRTSPITVDPITTTNVHTALPIVGRSCRRRGTENKEV